MRANQLLRDDSAYEGDLWIPTLGDESRAIARIEIKIRRGDESNPHIETTASLESGPYAERVQRTMRFRIP
jgi:hypothetical protein